MLPLPITLELTLVYSRYGCMQEFNALILPEPITLEPQLVYPDTDTDVFNSSSLTYHRLVISLMSFFFLCFCHTPKVLWVFGSTRSGFTARVV